MSISELLKPIRLLDYIPILDLFNNLVDLAIFKEFWPEYFAYSGDHCAMEISAIFSIPIQDHDHLVLNITN